MPFIIKSTGNQRTCTLVKSTTNTKTNTTREDLIEALKGLTLKFEVKIIDVEVDNDGDKPSVDNATNSTSPEDSQSKRVNNGFTTINAPPRGDNSGPGIQQKHASSSVPLEKPVPSIEVDGDYRPPGSTSEAPKREPIKDESTVRKESQPRRYDIQPMKTMIPPSVHLNELLRQAPTDDSKFQKETQEKRNITEQFDQGPPLSTKTESNEVPTEVTKLANKEKSSDSNGFESNEPVYKAPSSMEKPLEKPKPSIKAPLIRGTMNIGSTVNTCCISFDSTDQMPYVPFNKDNLLNITKIAEDCAQSIEDQSEVVTLEEGDIVLARSHYDDNWYRGRVEFADGSISRVFYFDWGYHEELGYNRIRRLTQANLGLSRYPACALKVKFTNEPGCKLLEEALKCEEQFTMDVLSYDEPTQTYTCKIIRMGAQ